MIDLKLSNHKLWDRALRLVVEGAEVDVKTAQGYLLRTVHQVDGDWKYLLNEPTARHVSAAFAQKRVVPRAMVLALKEKEGRSCSVTEAKLEVDAQPRLRLLFPNLRQ